MGMASRALSSLLPSWFRRQPYAPSPEEARGTVRRPMEEHYKRRIAELRPPRSRAPPDFSEALAYETEKRQWINEQKRLIAEAMQRAGAPDPRWNDHGGKDDRRKGRTAVIEELSAFEIKKRRWMAQHKRSIARARRRAGLEAAWRDRKVHPHVSTKTAGDPAKRPCATYAHRFGPGSDAAFLKSVLDVNGEEKSGGGVDRDSGRSWAERDDAHKRRQRYLTNYCPFQREQESVSEEERKRTDPGDDAVIERSVPVLPANDSPRSIDAEFLRKSGIQKNKWDGRRRSEEYYAMRREVLQSFKFVIDGSEKADVGVARRSACATRRNYRPFRTEEEAEEESVPENRKPEEPDDAEIERTVPVLPANCPESVDEKNPRRLRRGDEGYYAMRREVLQSFKFVTDGSEKAGVDVARRSACTRRRRNVVFLRTLPSRLRAPAAAKRLFGPADADDVADRR